MILKIKLEDQDDETDYNDKVLANISEERINPIEIELIQQDPNQNHNVSSDDNEENKDQDWALINFKEKEISNKKYFFLKILFSLNKDVILGIIFGFYYILYIFRSYNISREAHVAWLAIAFTISVFQQIEIDLKLYFLNFNLAWKQFKKQLFNIFELICSIAIFFSFLIVLILITSERSYSIKLINCILLARVILLFGILLKMQSMNSIFKTFITFAPLFLDLFAVLFIIFYFFAALGIHLFGGLLNKNIIPILVQHNISPDVIYLNYNDMIQSFLVSFMLLNMYWVTKTINFQRTISQCTQDTHRL